MNESDNEDRFLDEDNENIVDSGLEELQQYSQEHPSRISGRNLDDFLETGFQATKGQPPTPASKQGTLSFYNSIDSDINDTEDGESPSISDRRFTPTETNSHRIPISAFRKQWRYWCLMLGLGVANSSDATEILCISYILADPVFQNTVQKEHGAGLLAAAVFLGMLLGGLLVGTMGDWMGRKPTLRLGLVCNALSGILFALAPNFHVLSFLRCVAGFGIGATIPPLFTLASELAPLSARGFCTTIIASFWMVGSIYVALVAMWCFEGAKGDEGSAEQAAAEYFSATWRIFALICSFPSALGATLVHLFIPESPRFLGLEGRSEEAVEVANSLVNKMSGGTNESCSVLPLTIEELERTFPASALKDLEDRQRQQSRNYLGSESGSRLNDVLGFLHTAGSDFVSSTSKLFEPNLRRTTFALTLVWFSLSFGSYGLMTWINIIFEKVHLKDVYFNALLFAAANLPGNLLSAVFLDKVRRSTSLVTSIVCASASLVIFAVSASVEASFGIVTSACLFQCFTVVAWNTIDTMTSELFPTLVRSTGWGICAASARIGALIAQFVNGALVDNPVQLLLVNAATLVIGAVTPCLLQGVVGDMTGKPVQDDLQSTTVTRNGSLYVNGAKSTSGELMKRDDDTSVEVQRGGGNVVRRNARSYSSSDGE